MPSKSILMCIAIANSESSKFVLTQIEIFVKWLLVVSSYLLMSRLSIQNPAKREHNSRMPNSVSKGFVGLAVKTG